MFTYSDRCAYVLMLTNHIKKKKKILCKNVFEKIFDENLFINLGFVSKNFFIFACKEIRSKNYFFSMQSRVLI